MTGPMGTTKYMLACRQQIMMTVMTITTQAIAVMLAVHCIHAVMIATHFAHTVLLVKTMCGV